MSRRLLRRIRALPARAQLRLVWRLLADKRMPVLVRIVVPALVAYLFLPVDIIPDFIPVLGQLDDVLLVLLGLTLVAAFIPRHVLEEHIEQLEREARRAAA